MLKTDDPPPDGEESIPTMLGNGLKHAEQPEADVEPKPFPSVEKGAEQTAKTTQPSETRQEPATAEVEDDSQAGQAQDAMEPESKALPVQLSSQPTDIPVGSAVDSNADETGEESQVTADDIIDSLQKNRLAGDVDGVVQGSSEGIEPAPLSTAPPPSRQPSGIRARIRPQRGEKIGHRREVDGNVTYKQTKATDLMMGLQLGIQHSIGRLAGVDVRDILMEDFDEIEDVSFPKEGSPTTQAHTSSSFRLLTYAPRAFRYFRAVFGIEPADFMISLCNQPLKEVSNAGASGSLFYISPDDNFIMKTVQSKEASFLRKLLPGYFLNLTQNTKTLLPKFFGLYCYQSLLGRHIRLVIMNNVLPTHVSYHEKYDLKGSTYGRIASDRERAKSAPTLKDLDFLGLHPNGICLERTTFNALMRTLKRDVRVLESFGIMDYSLLMGVHYFSEDSARALKQKAQQAHHDKNYGFTSLAETLSVQQASADFGGGILAFTATGKPLLLFAGIIDILQQYRVVKKMEHFFKSRVYDGKTVSVCHPKYYKERFLEFIGNVVFKPIDVEKVREFMHHRASEIQPTQGVRRSSGAGLSSNSTAGLIIERNLGEAAMGAPADDDSHGAANGNERGLVPGTRPPVTVVTLASNISEVIDGAVEAGQSQADEFATKTRPGRLRAQSEYLTSRVGSAPEMHTDVSEANTPFQPSSPVSSRIDFASPRSAVSPAVQVRLKKPIERVSSLDNFVSSKLFDTSDVNITKFRGNQ